MPSLEPIKISFESSSFTEEYAVGEVPICTAYRSPKVSGGSYSLCSRHTHSFPCYGVVSLPEINDWRPLSVNDSYLVTATDGVFEQLKPQKVCDIFWELHTNSTNGVCSI